MPSYFSLSCKIKKEQFHVNLCRQLYDAVIACGFPFQESYSPKHVSYEQICEKSLFIKDKQTVYAYHMQALFSVPSRHALRAFWFALDGKLPELQIIWPEYELYPCVCCLQYKPEPMRLMVRLAKVLWETGLLAEINGCSELNAGLKIGNNQPGQLQWIQFAMILADRYATLDTAEINLCHEISEVSSSGIFLMRKNYDRCPHCKGNPEYLQ